MPVLIMFRSLTFAQRGARELERAGISAAVTKAPVRATDKGCSYCIRIGEQHLHSTLSLLNNCGIVYGRVLRINTDGELKEVLQ